MNFKKFLVGIFVLLAGVVLYLPVKIYAYDYADWKSTGESDYSCDININLDGGRNEGMTWSYSVDRGEGSGVMRFDQTPEGYFLSKEWLWWPNATPDFSDNEWPREGWFHEHMDCVGATPYVTIFTPSRDDYTFTGWDTNRDCFEGDGVWYFYSGCYNEGDGYIKATWRRNSSRQTIYVRYQNADGTWGSYSPVIDTDYTNGSTLSWSRPADVVYNSGSISYVVNGEGSHYIDISRRTYSQVLYVRYQDANGGWGSWNCVVNRSYRYGQTVSWSRGTDAVYAAASISFNVTGPNTRYVNVYRRTYNQKVYVRYQNPDGTWGSYSAVIDRNYYYGSNVSWSRPADDCYDSASVSFSANGSNIRYVDVSRKRYTFTIGGFYDGSYRDSFGNYATADIYINGNLAANDCTSYTGTVYYGASYRITDIKTVTGYTFDGVGGSYNSLSGTITMGGKAYLKFHLNKYTIHFDCVGGVNGPADITLYYGQEYTIENIPTRTGYAIKGWNTKLDGMGTGFQSNAILKNVTAVDNAAITLYAQWTQKIFGVVKSASSWHGGTFVKRTSGDDEWYNTVGKLKINESIPEEYIVQEWVIEKDGKITRVR